VALLLLSFAPVVEIYAQTTTVKCDPITLACVEIPAPTTTTVPTVTCDPISYQKESIDSYEIRKVGYGDVPPVKIISLDEGLVGQVYVEVNPERLISGESYSFIEFYAHVTQNTTDTCDVDGTLIDADRVGIKSSFSQYYDGYNLVHEPKDQEECFPRTTNGQIAAVLFMFEDPLYDEPKDMTIWNDADADDINDGSIQFCVRVGYKREINGSIQLISFLDTKIVVNVDLIANFISSFPQNVPITTVEQATNP